MADLRLEHIYEQLRSGRCATTLVTEWSSWLDFVLQLELHEHDDWRCRGVYAVLCKLIPAISTYPNASRRFASKPLGNVVAKVVSLAPQSVPSDAQLAALLCCMRYYASAMGAHKDKVVQFLHQCLHRFDPLDEEIRALVLQCHAHIAFIGPSNRRWQLWRRALLADMSLARRCLLGMGVKEDAIGDLVDDETDLGAEGDASGASDTPDYSGALPNACDQSSAGHAVRLACAAVHATHALAAGAHYASAGVRQTAEAAVPLRALCRFVTAVCALRRVLGVSKHTLTNLKVQAAVLLQQLTEYASGDMGPFSGQLLVSLLACFEGALASQSYHAGAERALMQQSLSAIECLVLLLGPCSQWPPLTARFWHSASRLFPLATDTAGECDAPPAEPASKKRKKSASKRGADADGDAHNVAEDLVMARGAPAGGTAGGTAAAAAPPVDYDVLRHVESLLHSTLHTCAADAQCNHAFMVAVQRFVCEWCTQMVWRRGSDPTPVDAIMLRLLSTLVTVTGRSVAPPVHTAISVFSSLRTLPRVPVDVRRICVSGLNVALARSRPIICAYGTEAILPQGQAGGGVPNADAVVDSDADAVPDGGQSDDDDVPAGGGDTDAMDESVEDGELNEPSAGRGRGTGTAQANGYNDEPCHLPTAGGDGIARGAAQWSDASVAHAPVMGKKSVAVANSTSATAVHKHKAGAPRGLAAIDGDSAAVPPSGDCAVLVSDDDEDDDIVCLNDVEQCVGVDAALRDFVPD